MVSVSLVVHHAFPDAMKYAFMVTQAHEQALQNV